MRLMNMIEFHLFVILDPKTYTNSNWYETVDKLKKKKKTKMFQWKIYWNTLCIGLAL